MFPSTLTRNELRDQGSGSPETKVAGGSGVVQVLRPTSGSSPINALGLQMTLQVPVLAGYLPKAEE